MPRKPQLLGDYDMTEGTQQVHNMIRFLSKSGRSDPQIGFFSGEDVDNHLNEWTSKGYRVHTVARLGDNEYGYGVLYVLIRG